MTTKLIDRLVFAQGGRCFFCQCLLTPGEASVEHLVASSNGGNNDPNNCVVCCQALNTLLGSMSLKEKLQVVLNQKGQFKCPRDKTQPPKPPVSKLLAPKLSAPKLSTPKLPIRSSQSRPAADRRLALVVADLSRRGAARPSTVKSLGNTISAFAEAFRKKLSEQNGLATIEWFWDAYIDAVPRARGYRHYYPLQPSLMQDATGYDLKDIRRSHELRDCSESRNVK